ncbi:MAG TPA: aminotransferase, partial [Dialister sp.]|nr:aminotransferase [Dialister sp.]
MIVEQFGVEDWMDRYEEGARYNITDTCAKPLTLNEFFTLSGEDKQDFMETFFQREQTYGPIWGDRGLKEEISHLYEHISPDDILTEHGATGGNQHIFFS